jgi:hypothetical protein
MVIHQQFFNCGYGRITVVVGYTNKPLAPLSKMTRIPATATNNNSRIWLDRFHLIICLIYRRRRRRRRRRRIIVLLLCSCSWLLC